MYHVLNGLHGDIRLEDVGRRDEVTSVGAENPRPAWISSEMAALSPRGSSTC